MSKVAGCPDFRVQKGPKWAPRVADLQSGHAQLPEPVQKIFEHVKRPEMHTRL